MSSGVVSTSMGLKKGDLIAEKYSIIDKLGTGSSGSVFLVRNEVGEAFALKLLRASLATDERTIARFQREAEILKNFTHPSVISLKDFGKEKNGYFIVTEFSSGTSLEKILAEKGALPLEQAIAVTVQVLLTLEAAHEKKIIHRDIKPQNILIEGDLEGYFTIKLLDFGIAKVLEESFPVTKLTDEGMTVGTPEYMSPEQAAGEGDLDWRVDIYSAGIMLYELIRGEVPFSGEFVTQTLLMHLTRAPKPFPLERKIPRYIERVVLKALQKDREKRFQSSEEFRRSCETMLERYLSSGDKEELSSTEFKGIPEVKTSGEGKKLLCVDDDQLMLNMVEYVFSGAGYEVLTTTDPSKVYDLMFEEGVRILLSDLNMPGIPGTKVCQMLKRALPDARVVLLSSARERKLSQAAERSGADGWLSKRSKPDEWIVQLQEILGIENE